MMSATRKSKADQRAHPADRIEEQRDLHAQHFVEDDVSWVGALEVPLGNRATPRAERENDKDGRELHDRRLREQPPEHESDG